MENSMQNTIENIKNKLDEIYYEGDLSDIGNAIGIAIGESLKQNEGEVGFDKEDFESGVKNGISLVDGTHP